MVMRNGGIIGVLNQPTSVLASGVWSLKEQEKAQKDGDWSVLPITITTVGTTVTQSDRDVTGINLSSVSLGDQLVIVYGSEGAVTVTSATLAGTAVTIDETSADTSTFASVAIMSVVADSNIAGAGSATLDITSTGTGTQFRCACSIFILSRTATAFAVYENANAGATLSATINFSAGALFTGYYDANEAVPTLTGVANQINEGMGSASSDFSIGYSPSANSGNASHSIGYTGGSSSSTAYAVVVYT